MVPIQYRPEGRTVKALADDLESAIRTERLAPGDPLPSIRDLADDLGVAPGTIAGAYASLRDRGLTVSQGRRGTFVRRRPAVGTRPIAPRLGPDVTDLSGGQPSPRLLPSLTAAMFADLRGPAAAPAEGLLPAFAEAARDRLNAEGIPVGELAACHGGLDGIRRVLSAQLRPGDRIALEDPGWPNAYDLVAAQGLRPIPVSIDEHGPEPESLAGALRGGARAMIITSRAHNPTGAFVDETRQAALAAVLEAYPDVLVVEDDHAAELSTVELHSLAGHTSRWAFVRSMSKPYGPDLRLGVIAGDPETVGRVAGQTRAGSGWVSTLGQRLALTLWTNASVAEQVETAGRTYDARRAGLIGALAEQGIQATGATGLNVWVPVEDETGVVTQLLQRGWAVAPGARFRQQSAPGIRVTVSGLDERSVPRFARDLGQVLSDPQPDGYTA